MVFPIYPAAHSVGSTAVIGVVGEEEEEAAALYYNITAMTTVGIGPGEGDETVHGTIHQNADGTYLRFTKVMQEDRAVDSWNFFSFAVGQGNSFGYHRHRDTFRMNLSECLSPHTSSATRGRHFERLGAFVVGSSIVITILLM